MKPTPYLSRIQEAHAAIVDACDRHHVPGIVSICNSPRRGWVLVTTLPWQRTPEFMADLATIREVLELHATVGTFAAGEVLEYYEPLPMLGDLGSPITENITNPTA